MDFREGQVVVGPLFGEPMRVEAARAAGDGSWVVGLVGVESRQFRRVTLRPDDVAALEVRESGCSWNGDGALLRLGLQAYSLGIAYEFDPYFGLFLTWLKRTLPAHPLLRDPFDPANPLSPKRQEIVQDETRVVNGRPKDSRFF